MTKRLIGLNRYLYSFSLDERDKYEACKLEFKGFYTEIFVNNGYCLEVKKRTFNI